MTLDMIADRLNEVSFAVPSWAVDKKGVIGNPKVFYDRLSRRVSQFIERADHEGLKSISGV